MLTELLNILPPVGLAGLVSVVLSLLTARTNPAGYGPTTNLFLAAAVVLFATAAVLASLAGVLFR